MNTLFRLTAILSLSLFISSYAEAVRVDFTDAAWGQAISDGNGVSATLGDITLTSIGGNLTFNGGASERNGCAAGASVHGLSCSGDGIGIRNDEITQGGSQSLLVTFSTPVMIDPDVPPSAEKTTIRPAMAPC